MRKESHRIALAAPLAAFAWAAGCGAPHSHTICQIQGWRDATPLSHHTAVTTSGVVHARETHGFYLQHENCDDDPNTSDGIFVFTRTANGRYPRHPLPEVGDLVRVRAPVVEFDRGGSWIAGVTELDAQDTRSTSVEVLASHRRIPEPAVIDVETLREEERRGAAQRYYESREGMRVRLATGTSYVGTNKFAESFVLPGLVPAGQRVGRVDAAAGVLALEPGLLGAGDLHLFAFDRVEEVVGALSYSFDNYKLRYETADAIRVTRSSNVPEPIETPSLSRAPRSGGGRLLAVATWNLENVFSIGSGRDQGIPNISAAAKRRKEVKVARAVIDELGRPDVLAVQEVERKELLDDMAAEINRQLASRQLAGEYRAFLLEGNDERGIDVGFVVDLARVSPGRVWQIETDRKSAGSCRASGGAAPTLLHDRPPLALEVSAGGRTVVAVNVHFKSKFRGSEDPSRTEWERCRVEQAESLLRGVTGLGEVILLGDFNAFRDSPAAATLQASGFVNMVDRIPASRRFSFVFQGRTQFLDHIFVSSPLKPRVVGVDSAKIASDVPIPLFRGDRTTSWAASDHDPLIFWLDL